jgi:hypothetical protein
MGREQAHPLGSGYFLETKTLKSISQILLQLSPGRITPILLFQSPTVVKHTEGHFFLVGEKANIG